MNNLDDNNYIGRVVYSKQGRDAEKYFVVLGVINKEYVYIADGSLRTVEKPKKKKVKHLIFTDRVAEEIRDLVLNGQMISNSKIKRFLQSEDNDKEV